MELIHEENGHGSYYLDVSFTGGGLEFSGQDLGRSVEDFWGATSMNTGIVLTEARLRLFGNC